ncbi:MAG: TonB-dependent receptor, partial [Alistipes sp.]|nr:TonB-dependent receptor [Alistipes sp.]
MKIKFLVSFFLLVAALVEVQAQALQGKVLDSEGQPLIGASVWWNGTTVGGSTDAEGQVSLYRVKGYDQLIASYLGYRNDTIRVAAGVERIEFRLETDGVAVEDVVIEGTQSGNFVKRDGIVKNEMISFAGLCKMACCNLAESFENSASVTVGYSDAISGARQIKMLGLAGTYTQILDENRPIMRGLSAPYGLSYTPGMWLNSIQVSKGVASVAAGHEAITGQINLEHRKPTDEERLFVNLYLDDELRP